MAAVIPTDFSSANSGSPGSTEQPAASIAAESKDDAVAGGEPNRGGGGRLLAAPSLAPTTGCYDPEHEYLEDDLEEALQVRPRGPSEQHVAALLPSQAAQVKLVLVAVPRSLALTRQSLF